LRKASTVANSFEPCVVDGGLRFAAHANAAIAVWGEYRSKSVTLGVAKQSELVANVLSRYPEGVVLVVVVVPGAEVPNSAQRQEIEAFFTRWAPSLRALVEVVEGHDLWSITNRSIMTAMRLVQRRPYPKKLFSEVSEGVKWAAEYTSKAPGESTAEAAQNLEKAIDELRRRVSWGA
jgi:hypothetical protein